MKKYIWEVGIDIQTIYVFPEADTADEADMLAEDEMKLLTMNWEGFDFDYYASSAQIEGVTQEYAQYVANWTAGEVADKKDQPNDSRESVRKHYTDTEILEFLIDIAEVDSVSELESYLRKTKGE